MILKFHTNIAKIFIQVLVTSTKLNTNVMGLKISLDTILLLKRHQFEGILNRIRKINGNGEQSFEYIAVTCSGSKSSMKMTSLKIIYNI